MSLIKANAVQIGQSPTATQNFTLAVPSSPDGTIKLARGNSGATTQDVISVDASGNVSFAGTTSLGNISNSTAIATGSTTARSLANRFADVANVRDFGAVGNGVTDDTAAIQAALNTGRNAYMPSGTYLISSGLSIIIAGQNIIGDGPKQTNILVSGSSYDAITISADYGGVEGVKIYSSLPRVSGAFININTATRGNYIRTFVFQSAYIGIHISADAVITYIENGEILDCTPSTGTGIIINGGNDTFINHIVMDSIGTEPLCGISVKKTQAIWVSDCDIINFGTPLDISPNGLLSGLVTWCFFSQLALDSSIGSGIQVIPSNGATVKGLFFDNCWSSTNNRGVYVASTSGGIVDTVHFTDCTFYNNQLQGALVDNAGGNVRNVEFNNCRAAGNSQAASGVSAGFDISNNVVNFAVRGCRSGAHAGFPATQSYGILIGTGCNEYVITDNNLIGNVTAAAFDNSKSTSTFRSVSNNVGYITESKGISTISSGNTSLTVSHGMQSTPSTVFITPSNVNLNGRSFWSGTYTSNNFDIEISSSMVVNSNFCWLASIY